MMIYNVIYILKITIYELRITPCMVVTQVFYCNYNYELGDDGVCWVLRQGWR
jgi:hypothetical protein